MPPILLCLTSCSSPGLNDLSHRFCFAAALNLQSLSAPSKSRKALESRWLDVAGFNFLLLTAKSAVGCRIVNHSHRKWCRQSPRGAASIPLPLACSLVAGLFRGVS